MKPITLILGGVVLLAAGGGAVALLMSGQRAAPPAVEEPKQADTPPPPSPPAAPPPVTVNFLPLVQDFSLVRDTAAYVSASKDAPQFYALKAGTPLISASRSPDGAWTVAMTEDGRAAFIPSDDLGPYDPSRAPQPALPQTVSGTAEVIDTGTLLIDGQTIPLAGVIGRKGELAEKMQAKITSSGVQVDCTLQQAGGYVCMLGPDFDIGRSALFNGAAEAASDATDDYRAQAEAGKAAHRGIWK